jgi:hypothetical protein
MPLYTAYGLQIDSELPLPELPPGSDRPVDVSVRLGSVPLELPDPLRRRTYFEGKPGAFLFRVPDVGRYMVLGGRDIVIERLPDCSDELLRIFLLGSTFGALLHQRRLLVMHASSVQTTDGAVLFVGPSGHGKSTLMAALARRGHAMLADDVTAVAVDRPSGPVAFPSFPRQRLGADVAEHLDYCVDTLPRVENSDKYLVPVPRFCSEPLPVHAVYALGKHDEQDIRVEPVESLQRFAVIVSNAYRHEFLECLGLREMHFHAATRLLEAVHVRSITRPASSLLLDELIDRLEEDLGQPVANTQEKEVI